MPTIVTGTAVPITDGLEASFTPTTSSRTFYYVVSGASDADAACAASGIPAMGDYYVYGTTTTSLQVSEVSAVQHGRDDLFKVRVSYTYNRDNGKPKNPVNGTEYWTLDINTQTANRRAAYSQTKFGAKSRDVGNLIGVGDDGNVAGVDLYVPHIILNVSQWKTPSLIPALIPTYNSCVGKFNTDATFYSFSAGEVLFKGVRITNRGGDLAELEFSFEIQQNESASDLPTFTDWSTGSAITITGGKKGWQYIWIDQAEKDSSGTKTVATRGVYVADVYKSTAFSVMGLTGTL